MFIPHSDRRPASRKLINRRTDLRLHRPKTSPLALPRREGCEHPSLPPRLRTRGQQTQYMKAMGGYAFEGSYVPVCSLSA